MSQEHKFCKKCGGPVYPGDKFCKNCGTATDEQPEVSKVKKEEKKVKQEVNEVPVTNTPPVYVQKPKSGAGWKYAFIILLLLVVIGVGVGVYFLFLRDDGKGNGGNPTPTNQVVTPTPYNRVVTPTPYSRVVTPTPYYQPAGTQKVKYEGFTFTIPEDYNYEIDDNALSFGNDADTWYSGIKVISGDFNLLVAGKEGIISGMESSGYTVNTFEPKEYNGMDTIVMEVTGMGHNMIIAYVKANSSKIFVVTVLNTYKNYDYSLFEDTIEILKSAV